MIHPHQVLRPGVDSIPGRKKRPVGVAKRVIPASTLVQNFALPTSPSRGRPIGSLWAGSHTSFSFTDRGGVVDSSLRADSAVPLARAVVVLIVAGPCHQGTLKDPTVTRTNPQAEEPDASGDVTTAKEVSRTRAVQ